MILRQRNGHNLTHLALQVGFRTEGIENEKVGHPNGNVGKQMQQAIKKNYIRWRDFIDTKYVFGT